MVKAAVGLEFALRSVWTERLFFEARPKEEPNSRAPIRQSHRRTILRPTPNLIQTFEDADLRGRDMQLLGSRPKKLEPCISF